MMVLALYIVDATRVTTISVSYWLCQYVGNIPQNLNVYRQNRSHRNSHVNVVRHFEEGIRVRLLCVLNTSYAASVFVILPGVCGSQALTAKVQIIFWICKCQSAIPKVASVLKCIVATSAIFARENLEYVTSVTLH